MTTGELAALLAENARMREALEVAEVGMCAVGVPHASERAVLSDAVAIVRAALAGEGAK